MDKKISSRNFRAVALETLKENPMLVVPSPLKSAFTSKCFSIVNLVLYHINKKMSIGGAH
ncbi:hypothetical protein CVU82_00130 [Candidatus Falkowbacteria bacterium HGW-Falkowbacteria-1]|uniref:Uncharacterized protein n=1 Tax=Candidatus Falkowbacteria bacterium HGW-Falkowbacteria-1 TaxID=2013768 RepID=A0A2N2EA58_9BACT|nr:MAG: hypothetical protein CVU82_00130 [Candidatus Falkowbacteria bacterium HGW-Falkowbacteria-1]